MTTANPRWLIVLAAALSLLAALLHGWVMPEHFEEWWGYGAFFLVVAIAQTLYAFLLLRDASSPGLIWAGVLGNLAIIVLWAWTRTAGIPMFGPHAGEVEEIGAIDVVSKISEALLIACLVVLLRIETTTPRPHEGTRRQRYA
jgi:energy-coupling factor transporter transmembrane protein EcfT